MTQLLGTVAIVGGSHVAGSDSSLKLRAVRRLPSSLLQVLDSTYILEEIGTDSIHKAVLLTLRSGGFKEQIV